DRDEHGGNQWLARTAAQRVASGADHEERQGLRGERFHEPAGVEFGLRGMQPYEQYVKSEKVVQRADRPHAQHEPADRTYVPAARSGQLRSIHVVAGNGDLRDVIEEIVEQDLG